MGFYAWELDQDKQVLRLKYLLHQDLRGKLYYKIKEFAFYKGSLLEIFRVPFKRQQISNFRVFEDKQICHYIQQQLYYQNPFWMKQQAEAYQKGENLLTFSLKDWYPQVKPILANDFCQISQDLSSYYTNFQTYYQTKMQNDFQNLYPPAFYHQYFRENVVK